VRNLSALLLLTGSLPAAENPRVEYAMGVLEDKRGNPAVAQTHHEKALQLDPLSLPLVQNAVEIRLGAGDREGAVKLMRDLAAKSPDRVDVQLSYSHLLEQQGRGDAMAQKLAIEVLEKVLEKKPGDIPVTSRLLHIFRERGDKQKALALMDQLPADDPLAAPMYASAAQAVFDKDDLPTRDRVDRRYYTALLAHPKNVTLVRAASDYFRETGRADEALEILRQHVKVAPWSLDLRTRLGILLFSAKQDAEGEKTLKEVIEIRPRSEQALQSLAKFYRLKGDEAQARIYGAELLKYRGGSPREFEVLANEFLAADDPRSARLLLEKAVFDHPKRIELATKLAVATRRDPETRHKAGRLFLEAEAAMGATSKMDPDFLLESADCLIEEGKGKAAEERLRNAIKSFPADRKTETASALRRLAALWEKENRNLDAAKALKQRADALDP
jgi:Flp pilus assembly protein TadD